MKKYSYILLFILMLIPNMVFGKELNIYLFHGDGCPHCRDEIAFFDEYLEDKDNIHLYKYEVWYDKDNVSKLEEVAKITGKEADGIPYLVIGDYVISGFSTGIQKKIVKRIEHCLENSCPDKTGVYLGKTLEDNDVEDNYDDEVYNVPILGEISAKDVSIPILAIVIGLVDGFNPCAMWILIFLISMLFGMKDKKKMWTLGLTFILTSGIVYFLFMASWLNLASFINKVSLVRSLIGAFAIIFGIVNVYNYIKSRKKDAGCEVTDEKKRKKIISYIKKIVSEKKFIIALLGIMVLAFLVNLIELLCSLGLPVIFTEVLSLNNLSTTEYILYMLLYIIFFLIDDIIIFVIAMKTLEIKAISNKYTKYSHLIGGIIMLILGVLLILKPEWLMFNF